MENVLTARKFVMGAAATALLLGLASVPASAGRMPANLVVNPGTVEQGGSVTISNADEPNSTCEADSGATAVVADNSLVTLEIEDPDGDPFDDVTVEPDAEGNWSYVMMDLGTLGTYTVNAFCDEPGISPKADGTPAASPGFIYEESTFLVIAQATTTTTATADSTTTTVSGTGGTGGTTGSTTTTAGTAAVKASPTYTG